MPRRSSCRQSEALLFSRFYKTIGQKDWPPPTIIIVWRRQQNEINVNIDCSPVLDYLHHCEPIHNIHDNYLCKGWLTHMVHMVEVGIIPIAKTNRLVQLQEVREGCGRTDQSRKSSTICIHGLSHRFLFMGSPWCLDYPMGTWAVPGLDGMSHKSWDRTTKKCSPKVDLGKPKLHGPRPAPGAC